MKEVIAACEEAGRAVLNLRGSRAATKSDGSPVTAADMASHRILLACLKQTGLPVVSEEAPAETDAARYWLMDPLDGTKEFLADNGEYTVNVALIEDGVPTKGVVHVPATQTTYVADNGGYVLRDHARYPLQVASGSPLRVLVSRSHGNPETEQWLARAREPIQVRRLGSSLKFCLLAEGLADVYPRFGPTMQWDTAAGHAVLAAAGGKVLTWDGAPLSYGKPRLNPSFIALGGGAGSLTGFP